MYRNIIVPVDGSTASEEALPTAAEIARRSGATLHIVQIIGWLDEISKDTGGSGVEASVQATASRIAVEYDIAVVGSGVFDPVTGVDYTVPPSEVVPHVLDRYIKDHHIDLCVMTTHGRGGVARVFMGSVADGILHESRVQCLLMKNGMRPVHERPPLLPQRILVPVDFSDRDELLIEHAFEIGDLYDAQYTLIHVMAPALLPVAAGAMELMGDAEAARRIVAGRLGSLAASVESPRRRVHTAVVTMPFAASELVDYASSHRFDLVVIATRARSGLKRAILGSVADKVARHATMPVLVCPDAHRPPR
jgi:nucleotide-binding universal stress UspA family protein